MSHKSNRPDIGKPPDKTADGRVGERIVESTDLLGAAKLVLIRHQGRIYCLRRTRLGKLILTA